MTNTERYPIDFEALKRGDVITEETIERAAQGAGITKPVAPASWHEWSDYNKRLAFYRMGLVEEIQNYFRDVHTQEVKVKQERDSLRILRGDEQDDFVAHEYRRVIRQFGKTLGMDLHNDLGALTGTQKVARMKRITDMSWKMQQLRKRKPPELTENGEDSSDQG